MQWVALAVAALMLGALAAWLFAAGQLVSGSGTATIRIGDGSIQFDGEEVATLEAVNVDAPGVCAITVGITYEPAVKVATACDADPHGLFDTAVCNVTTPGTVSFTAIKAAEGVNGSFPLTDITWHGEGDPGECTLVDLTIATFADCDGSDIAVNEDDGNNCIASPLPGPTLTPTPLAPSAIPMVAGWNDKCYIGEQTDIQDALTGIEDKVLAIYILNESQQFDRWFPDSEDASTITSLNPYDQLFVLMSEAGTWVQEPSGVSRPSISLVEGWNSVCYTGETKAVEEATSGIAEAMGILYRFLDTQVWATYVPDRSDLSDITQLGIHDSVLILITEEAGSEWTFDP